MHARIDTFSFPKAGNSPAENEDACAPKSGDYEGSELSVAIADGASESFLAGRWARFLTRAYLKHANDDQEGFVAQLIEQWPLFIKNYVCWREAKGRPLLWFEEAKLEAGAHATFLGLELNGDREGTWQAFAVGDTCLFQVRAEELIARFPIDSSSDFNLEPALVSSRPEGRDRVLKSVEERTGRWLAGDVFYLMTDALAAWFLSAVERDGRPWALFPDFKTDSMSPWIEDLRSKGCLKNDDVTILRMKLE